MKKITILLSLVLLHLFASPQHQNSRYTDPYTLWSSYILRNSNSVGYSNSITYPFSGWYINPNFSPCKPVQGIDYTENVRTPLQPFHFQKLHFETMYGYYLKITLDIDASGQSVIMLEDDYYAESTTIKSAMDSKDFTDLKHILARCDFESFREEKVKDDMKCCNSFFEISFNDETKKSRGCAFSPFDNRELESALWHFIIFKMRLSKLSPTVYY